MPTVSVIIPTYNRADIIGEAIRSVQVQTFENWEIIVVDDASKDDTDRVVTSIDDARVRYIKHECNRGGSAARNTGIKHSSGEYLAFLDSDDLWFPKKLENQLKVFWNSSSNVGLVYTGTIIKEGCRKLKPYAEGWITNDLLVKNVVGGCSVGMIKKEVISTVGLFDESLPSSQDKDFWLRISKEYRFKYVDDCMVLKRNYKEKYQISNNGVRKCIGKLKFYNKHRDLFGNNDKSKYLQKMGREFRLNMINRNKVARKCFKIAITEDTCNMKALIYLLLSYLPKNLDKFITS